MRQIGARAFVKRIGVCLGVLVTGVLLLAAPALAQAPPPVASASPELTPAQKGRAAIVDAFLTSDASVQTVAKKFCQPDDHCETLPNLFVILAKFDPEGYQRLLNLLAREDMVGGNLSAAAQNATFGYATNAIAAAVVWIDDDGAAAALLDSADVMRDMKAVYPRMCTNMLTGATVAPPAETNSALATAKRLRANLTLLEQAAANRERVRNGQLTLRLATKTEVDDAVGEFFTRIPKEQLNVLMRIVGKQEKAGDDALACDLMVQLFQYLSSLPKNRAGDLLRGMSAEAVDK